MIDPVDFKSLKSSHYAPKMIPVGTQKQQRPVSDLVLMNSRCTEDSSESWSIRPHSTFISVKALGHSKGPSKVFLLFSMFPIDWLIYTDWQIPNSFSNEWELHTQCIDSLTPTWLRSLAISHTNTLTTDSSVQSDRLKTTRFGLCEQKRCTCIFAHGAGKRDGVFTGPMA